jgi:hypothetical protein
MAYDTPAKVQSWQALLAEFVENTLCQKTWQKIPNLAKISKFDLAANFELGNLA